MTIVVPESVKITLDMLVRAADAGQPCPTNKQICERIGSPSAATAVRCIALLEAAGMIEVERGSGVRVVTVNGKKTAGDVRTPRPYVRATTKAPRKRYEDAWSRADDALLMERIAEGDDFEQAALLIGKMPNVCSARFDFLAKQYDGLSYALEAAES